MVGRYFQLLSSEQVFLLVQLQLQATLQCQEKTGSKNSWPSILGGGSIPKPASNAGAKDQRLLCRAMGLGMDAFQPCLPAGNGMHMAGNLLCRKNMGTLTLAGTEMGTSGRPMCCRGRKEAKHLKVGRGGGGGGGAEGDSRYRICNGMGASSNRFVHPSLTWLSTFKSHMK